MPGPGGGVCAWSRGGAAPRGGVPGPGGVGIPACIEAQPPPPVNRMTNRCKNITLATTSLRPVKSSVH